MSEGEYVTLGAFEKDDLAAAIEYLRNSQKTSTIALWGRSMGAATALLHAERDPSIAGMVLDSSFSDLSVLADELVEHARKQGIFAPSFAVYLLSKFIRSSVLKTAGLDIKTLSPIEHADRCFVPALFIAAEHDQFIIPKHSQTIHERAQDKQRQMSAKSSFHTFHTVFDQVESDQVLRQPSNQSMKSTSSSASIQGRSVLPVSQLLSMADPFDDEVEVDVEVVDEQGNKRIVKQRRKKVDEFADDNEVPIHDNEIVGMDETLEELSLNLGSNSVEFWSHVGSKSASAQSSMRHIVGDSSSNSHTSSHSSLLPLSSPVIPKGDAALPPVAMHDGVAPTLPPLPPTATTRPQHSVSHAESLLLDDDDDSTDA
eukprot:gene5997-4307_t